MKARSYKSLMAIVVAIGLWTTAALAEPIPIWEGFEGIDIGVLAPTNIGAITYTGTLAVVDTDAAEGQQSLHMSSDDTSSSMVVAVDPAQSNVWTLIYTKPAFNVDDIFELMAPGDDTALMFGVNTNGYVVATDGAGWQTNDVKIVENEWVGFAVNADYDAATYDLYLATNAMYGGSLMRIFDDLAFNAGYTGTFMSALEISTDLSAFVDAVSLEISELDPGEAIGTYVTPTPVLTRSQILPPAVAANENTFGGALGDELAAILSEGDKVRVYFGDLAAPDPSWQEYTLGPGGVWEDGRLDLEIDPSQGIFLVKVASEGVRYLPHSAPARSTPSAQLFEGDDWNLLAWTAPSASPADSDQWYFAGVGKVAAGDQIIVHDPATGIARTFQWEGGAWREFPNVWQATDFVMPQNRVFWFRGKDTGAGVTWEP